MNDPFTHAAAHGHGTIKVCQNPRCRSTKSPRRLTRKVCDACYSRWLLAGFPDSGIPDPGRPGWPLGRPRRPYAEDAARWDTYIWLRSPDGGSLPHAAARATCNEAALCAPAAGSRSS